MKNLYSLLTLGILTGCSPAKTTVRETVTNASYGYSKTNPIKVGGDADGPLNERKFLSSLSGPNGETVWYDRKGSCCHFETKNSAFGMGALDIYKVSYEGKNDTVTLYLNMYDKETLQAPAGFKFKD